MADIISKNYEPPTWFQDGMSGADEASDLRWLHSSAAVIRLGQVPIVAIENLTITVNVSKTPIMVIGCPVAIGFDFSGYTVNVSGQLVLNAASGLNKSEFFSKSVEDVVRNINQVFDIDIIMQDAFADTVEERQTQPFITIKNCTNTGETITLSNNTNLRQSFTAQGTFMQRSLDTALINFNKVPA